jgi:hypothetical protein
VGGFVAFDPVGYLVVVAERTERFGGHGSVTGEAGSVQVLVVGESLQGVVQGVGTASASEIEGR